MLEMPDSEDAKGAKKAQHKGRRKEREGAAVFRLRQMVGLRHLQPTTAAQVGHIFKLSAPAGLPRAGQHTCHERVQSDCLASLPCYIARMVCQAQL